MQDNRKLTQPFGTAQWLNFGEECEAVIATKTFTANGGAPALLTVCGLGFCEIYINGVNAAPRLFAPAWTNYLPTDTAHMNYPIYDTMTYRILYEEIDVTPLIKDGENRIVFHIGGGWFCQHESRNEGVTPYGKLTLCFNLTQNGASLAKSDGDVLYKKSFITRQNIYFGEIQDLRIGGYNFSAFDEGALFKHATPVPAPAALLCRQDCPPDRVIRTLYPKEIFRRGDYAIYDLGENAAGYPVVRFDETAIDEVITLRFAEALDGDGGLDFSHTGGNDRIQREVYIYDGKAKFAHQHFTWHAGRYFDVLGNAKVREFKVVHTDLKQKAVFTSSEPVLQWLFDSFILTQLCNSHTCVPSDCPHRERLGYTGDGQLTSGAVMDCFEAEGFYRKWIRDIADSQDIHSGHVQHTAPFYGGGGGPGGWGGAMVFVPYHFYQHYGDRALLETYYPHMLSYLDYMEQHSVNGLVTHEETGGWCLGDWCSPENKNLIPPAFVNTFFHLRALQCVIEIAGIIGRDAAALHKKKNRVTAAFLANYYDGATGTFCDSVEAADAFGCYLGLGDERTLAALIKKYTALGEFDTGIFGTYFLIAVLCDNGYTDLAKALLTSKKEHSFYHMMSCGATTLWETWEGGESRNHPMFGAVVEYLLKYFNEA